MCSSQLPSTRFRAIVETTSDGSQPLLAGAWESLSHRCRLPAQARPVQTPDTSPVVLLVAKPLKDNFTRVHSNRATRLDDR